MIDHTMYYNDTSSDCLPANSTQGSEYGNADGFGESFTPLHAGAPMLKFTLAGSSNSHPSDASLPPYVEQLADHLYKLARAYDKKTLFVEKIAGLVRSGDIRVNPSFKPPEAPFMDLEPSPIPCSKGGMLFEHAGLALLYSPQSSSTTSTLLSSTDDAHLECVSSRLFNVNGRTQLSASGGSVYLVSSKRSHSLSFSTTTDLALVSVSATRTAATTTTTVPANPTPAPAVASSRTFTAALPVAGTRLDLASSVVVTPAFGGSLIHPITFTATPPSAWRIELRRGDPAEESSQSGSQAGSPTTMQQVHVSATSSPTVVHVRQGVYHVVHISSAIEGVAALRVIDKMPMLFVIPGAHHYAGRHMRIPRIDQTPPVVPPAAAAAAAAAAAIAVAPPTRRGVTTRKRPSIKRTTGELLGPALYHARLQQAILQGDNATANSLILSCEYPTELMNARNAFGETALHLAISTGNTHLVSLCLQHGADPLTRDYSGLTAVQWAEAQQNMNTNAICRILQDKIAAAALYERGTPLANDESSTPRFPMPSAVRAPKSLNCTTVIPIPVMPTRAVPMVSASVGPQQNGNNDRDRNGSTSESKRKLDVVIEEPPKRAVPPKRNSTRSSRQRAPPAAALSEATSTPTVDWLELPPALLVYIFSLSSYDDLPALMRTCRTFKHLASPWRIRELRVRPVTQWHAIDVTPKMREILVEWLVEVQQEYRLHRNTLSLSVYYLDRVLSTFIPPKRDLQLLGATCMWIASKFEELLAPTLRDFVFICDSIYRPTEFAEMECKVLDRLNFELSGVTVVHFVTEYLADLGIVRPDLVNLVYFFAELALWDQTLAVSVPSACATAIIMLVTSEFLRDAECLSCQARLRLVSGYGAQDEVVRKHMSRLAGFMSPQHKRAKVIWEKYSKPEYNNVARQALILKTHA